MGAVPERSSWTRGKNWHGNCKDDDSALNLREAYHHGELDWTADVEPIFYRGPINPKTGKATPIQVPDKMAVIRSTDNNYIATVGTRFTPFQNEILLKNMETLLGEDCLAESAISLFGGAVVLIAARAPKKFKILQDVYKQYYFLANRHDGKGRLFGGFTNVRVVCDNTRRAAMAEADNLMEGITHTASGLITLEECTRILKAGFDNRILLAKEAQQFYDIKLTQKKYEGIVNELLPFPEDATKRQINKVEERRSLMWMAIKATDLENIKRTGWGLLQAVIDYAEHAPPVKKTELWEDRRILTTLQGDPLVKQAEELILAYN